MTKLQSVKSFFNISSEGYHQLSVHIPSTVWLSAVHNINSTCCDHAFYSDKSNSMVNNSHSKCNSIESKLKLLRQQPPLFDQSVHPDQSLKSG